MGQKRRLPPQNDHQTTLLENPLIKLGIQDDAILLRQVFPTEIWLKVLSDASPYDLPNIYYTSEFLAKLLRPKSESFMAQVLKFVLPYIVVDKIAVKVLKNCRLVCRLWCKAVNFILQDESAHLSTRAHYDDNFRVAFSDANCILKFKNYLTHLDNGRNPFISRDVKINICYSEFLLEVIEILKTCGRHIWHLQISINELSNTDLNNQHRLMQLVPNLKTLRVNSLQPNMDPIPYYPKLQHIFVSGDLNYHLLQGCIQNNSHVQSVSTCQAQDSQQGSYHWTNITAKPERFSTWCDSVEDFQQIGGDHVNWPLSELNIRLRKAKPVVWKEIGRCFTIMETKFGNTLERLNLEFPEVDDYAENITLHLPKLTSLSLKLTFYLSLDFLLPMKNNLQFLDVTVDPRGHERKIFGPSVEEKTVKFFTVENKCSDSNVFDVFTKLKRLKYCHWPLRLIDTCVIKRVRKNVVLLRQRRHHSILSLEGLLPS